MASTRLQITRGNTFLYIPTEGQQTLQFGCEFVENNIYRELLPEETVTWQLEDSIQGVSIDSQTGLLTIDNTVVDPSETTVIQTMGQYVANCPIRFFHEPDMSNVKPQFEEEIELLEQSVIELTELLSDLYGGIQ